jgi:hypothetical protein
MKIIYLPKTFASNELLSYHGVYQVAIDTENKKVKVSVGSWGTLEDAKKQIKPNVLSEVTLNYDTWIPEFYDNLSELTFMTQNWQGADLVEDGSWAPTEVPLQSPQELAQIYQLWLSMNSGQIPKVEPFFSGYQQ